MGDIVMLFIILDIISFTFTLLFDEEENGIPDFKLSIKKPAKDSNFWPKCLAVVSFCALIIDCMS
jgi:hypothetical protein